MTKNLGGGLTRVERWEWKYLVRRQDLAPIYAMLSTDGIPDRHGTEGVYDTQTMYLADATFRALDGQAGCKLRVRQYGRNRHSSTIMLEFKSTSNNRSLKIRAASKHQQYERLLRMSSTDLLNGCFERILEAAGDANRNRLGAGLSARKTVVQYQRQAWTLRSDYGARLTVDSDVVAWYADQGDRSVVYRVCPSDTVVLEVKHAIDPAPLLKWLAGIGLFPIPFSKLQRAHRAIRNRS